MHIHVVKRGESLWKIAAMYHADITQITLANSLDDPGQLLVGEALVIPEKNREYVVQAGDTLYQIAQIHGLTVEQLADANNITNPEFIYIGDVLYLPKFDHEIQQGETIWSIAASYGITAEKIIQANHLINPALIYPGEIITIPAQHRPAIEVNAYTTRTGAQGKAEVLALGRHFTFLSPFSYSIKQDGTITELNDEPVLEAADLTNTDSLLVLTNFSEGSFSSDIVATILRNDELQETLITNILETIKEKGYQGINVDFEYVYPEDRENYNNFLRRMVARFRPEGLLVTTALAPKESTDQTGLLYEAHDYQAHGEIVDFVIIMTYEWGWAGGSPLAIAPINKVRDVLDYATTVIPSSKIMLGVPLYGRDWKVPWVQGTLARTVSPLEAIRLARTYQVEIHYNETFQSPFFNYTDASGQQHEVWFEDARSVQAKYDAVKAYQLRGVSYWVLGSPFPQNWPVLQNNFQSEKR